MFATVAKVVGITEHEAVICVFLFEYFSSLFIYSLVRVVRGGR